MYKYMKHLFEKEVTSIRLINSFPTENSELSFIHRAPKR